jgi:hypothetical protein
MVAHATHNEDYKILDGDPGCQSGNELQARRWYQRGWTHIYRAVDEQSREKIAVFIEKAVANGFIGYDTNRRNRDTLFQALQENGYQVDEVEESVHCDCAALVYCAVYPVTGVEFVIDQAGADEALINICPKVRHYVDYIENQCSGMFEKYTSEQHINSADGLIRGDIMVAEGAHIAVWI